LPEDNRIHVRIDPELMPVREGRLDLNAEIAVQVRSRLTPLGIAGVVTIGLGVAALVAGLLVFLATYPEDWYTNASGWAQSRRIIERIVLLFSGGIVALFLGTSMFFYGRTVLGAGTLDQFQSQQTLEQQPSTGATQ